MPPSAAPSVPTPGLRLKLDTAVLRTALNLPVSVQRRLAGAPVVLDGQRLAPETQLMLRLQDLVREPRVEDLPLEMARDALVRQSRMVGGRQPIGEVRDLVVEGAVGPLDARLYTPRSRVGTGVAPTMLFLHGGGFMYGDLESHDAASRFLAENSGVQLLAVDYRLAPEHPFPAAVDDAVAAYRWLVGNTAAVNADPERLAVGGDSAGGNLSTNVAIAAAQDGLPLALQLLIYPGTTFVEETRSRELFRNGFYLNEGFVDGAAKAYLADPEDGFDPRASPLRRQDLPSGMAPAYVVTAGFDPLRDEGQAYAALLAEHDVSVEATCYDSMIHGFFNVVGCGREARSHNLETAHRLGQALHQRG